VSRTRRRRKLEDAMSSAPISAEPQLHEARTDPFFYGWRYLSETRPNGKTVSRQVPLTAEDVLHPQEGDFIVNTPLHDVITTYLKPSVESQFLDRKDVLVLGDTRINWGSRHGWVHGPDVVLFDRIKGTWSKTGGTFHVKRTGARVLLVIEVTSPATRAADFGDKLREYFLIGVPVYVIVDLPQSEKEGGINLFAYQAGQAQYEPLAKDDEGRIWLDAANLWLAAKDMEVFLQDADGRRLPRLAQSVHAVQTAERLKKRLRKSEGARKRAAKRIGELERELARLRGKNGV
jgi:Uma2 family endonuclease